MTAVFALLGLFVPFMAPPAALGVLYWAGASCVRGKFRVECLDNILAAVWIDVCKGMRVHEAHAADQANRVDRFELVGKVDNRQAYMAWREQVATWLQGRARKNEIHAWISDWSCGAEKIGPKVKGVAIDAIGYARTTGRAAVIRMLDQFTAQALRVPMPPKKP